MPATTAFMQSFLSPAQGVHVLQHSLPVPSPQVQSGVEQGLPAPAVADAGNADAAAPELKPGTAQRAQDSAVDIALVVGHNVGDYVIEQVLAARGTTLVYRAKCVRSTGGSRPSPDQTVVLKEYLPMDLAQRAAGGLVQPRDTRLATVYAIGLHAFLNEARLLADFEHPALAKVLQFWEQDGTAYQVLPFLEGVSLNKWLADLGTPPSETWLRQMLLPLLQVMAYLHEQGCWHGGLSADNIWLLADPDAGSYLEQRPRPVLLGLDAARRALAQATQDAATLLASGYVPVELSDGAIAARRGPWTDVYGLCALLYAAVVGRAPPSPMTRLVRDDMVSARKLGRGRYSNELLTAIDAGLVVQPAQRTQNMADFQAQLVAPAAVLHAVPATAVPPLPRTLLARTEVGSSGLAGGPHGQTPTSRRARWVWPAVLGALLLLVAVLTAFFRV